MWTIICLFVFSFLLKELSVYYRFMSVTVSLVSFVPLLQIWIYVITGFKEGDIMHVNVLFCMNVKKGRDRENQGHSETQQSKSKQ